MMKFTITYLENPLYRDFSAYRKTRLGSYDGQFFDWYRWPEASFPNGCIIATAWDNNIPIATCIIRIKPYDKKSIIGFYTKRAYRKKGLAKKLGQLATKKFEEIDLDEKYFQAYHGNGWGSAYYICQKYLKSIPLYY